MKKKILFILHLPPPVHGSSMVGQYIKDSKLVNDTFDSRYINLSTSKTIDEIGKNPFIKITRYFKILFGVVASFIKFKPELMYLAITAKGIGFYKDYPIAVLAKLFGKRLVLHYHNKGVSERQYKFVDNLLYRFLFKNNKVILLSENLYKDVAKYVVKKDVLYCPNGIPVPTLSKATSSKINEVPKLLFLSNLIESKGVYVLLDALKLLKNQGVIFQCNFVGGEGDISAIAFNEKVQELKLDAHVFYLGRKYDQEKIAVFESSDIFVHPTFSDCFPLVLLEASQFGLPLVSTFEGAIPEIIEDGVNGFLVTKKDVKTLADKLEVLIKDEILRAKLGNAAYKKYLNEYTLSKFESNMCLILKSII